MSTQHSGGFRMVVTTHTDEAPTLPPSMAANLGYQGDDDTQPVKAGDWANGGEPTQALTLPPLQPYTPPAAQPEEDPDRTQVVASSAPGAGDATVFIPPPAATLDAQPDRAGDHRRPSDTGAAATFRYVADAISEGVVGSVSSVNVGRATAEVFDTIPHGVQGLLAGMFAQLREQDVSREDIMRMVVDAMHRLP